MNQSKTTLIQKPRPLKTQTMFTLLHKARFFTSSLFAFTLSLPIPSRADERAWQPTFGSGPGRRRAHQLFDAGFSPTPTERAVLTQLDQVQLHGLVIRDLKPSEVLVAIQARIVAAKSEITLAWDPTIDLPAASISFTQRDMWLVNALYYLRGLADVHYEIRAGQILARRDGV